MTAGLDAKGGICVPCRDPECGGAARRGSPASLRTCAWASQRQPQGMDVIPKTDFVRRTGVQKPNIDQR